MTNLTVPVGAENGLEPISVPDEGEEVVAATVAPGKGPVRPGYLGLLRRWYALIRGKISLKSLTVDLLGEQVVGAPAPGAIRCQTLTATSAVNGQVGLFSAEVEAAEFDAVGGVGRVDYEQARVQFRNTTTGGTGANPPFATVIRNELRALNIPKCFGLITTDGAGGFTLLSQIGQTFNVKSARAAATYIEIEMATPMDNANYCILAVGSQGVSNPLTLFPTAVDVNFFRLNTPANDPRIQVLYFHFLIFGLQST